jgi:hypothetical protein
MGTGLAANPDSFRGALNEAIRKARVSGREATNEANSPS